MHEIEMFGIKLTKKQFPNLAQWAETDIEGLRQTIKDLDKRLGGESNPTSAMMFLENDLQHG
jgi:hypothetical protein